VPSIEIVSFAAREDPAADLVNSALLGVDRDLARARDAALAPAAGDDGRVAGHAARARQDARRGVHAADVLGAGLLADQDDLLAGVGALDGLLGGERRLARPPRRATRAGRAQHVGSPSWSGRSWAAAAGEVARRDPQQRLLFVISFSLTMSQAIFTAAAPVRLPVRVCSIQSLPRSMVNSMSCMSL
jgi:hypothetical protein